MVVVVMELKVVDSSINCYFEAVLLILHIQHTVMAITHRLVGTSMMATNIVIISMVGVLLNIMGALSRLLALPNKPLLIPDMVMVHRQAKHLLMVWHMDYHKWVVIWHSYTDCSVVQVLHRNMLPD